MQLLLTYGGGGHVVTLDGFSWNDANGDGIIQSTENAQVSLIDPWTGLAAAAQVKSMADGSLQVVYNGQGEISSAFAISVPEPSSVGLLAMGARVFSPVGFVADGGDEHATRLTCCVWSFGFRSWPVFAFPFTS